MTGEPGYSVRSNATDDWDQTLGLFSDASIMQTRSYAAARWPRSSLEQITVMQHGEVIGAAQIVVRSIPVLGGGLAYVHFGPVWRRHETRLDSRNFETTVRCMVREYVDQRGMLLRIRPANLPTDEYVVSEFLSAEGFSQYRDESPDRFLVDLSFSPDEIQKGFSSKWRYNLRRSRKYGLEVIHADGSEGMNQFLEIYREMLSRKTFVDTSAIDEFPEIYASLPPSFKPQILLCRRAGVPIAGVIVSQMGDTALYLFGASSADATKACAGYLLQWSVICELRDKGCRWYDLGGDSGNAGLRQFKSGMVGRRGRIVPLSGNFEKCSNGLSRAIVRLALAGRNAVLATRNLLNRTTSA